MDAADAEAAAEEVVPTTTGAPDTAVTTGCTATVWVTVLTGTTLIGYSAREHAERG